MSDRPRRGLLVPHHVRRRAAAAVSAGVVVLTVFVGCSEDEETPPEPDPTPPPTAEPAPPAPEEGACYRLSFRQALAPTTQRKPRACDKAHAAETYRVGRLDTLVRGHLLAVDSDRVQAQVAADCPDALGDFVGGDRAALRLSMIRPVWFTASVEESDLGADWYRCDAVVVAGDDRLVRLTASLEGVLDRPADRDRFAMCGTAPPDSKNFERVTCDQDHSWRAISVVPFDGEKYPGKDAAQEAGQEPCENAGLDAADDPLDYQWGYEWPTEEQWAMGQNYGRCWAPD